MPKVGDGQLTALLEGKGFPPRLTGTGLTFRRLELEPKDCTPVHCHLRRVKLYDPSRGVIKVFLWQPRFLHEKPNEFFVGEGRETHGEEFFVIPPGYPHAIMYWECDEWDGTCVIHITATPDDPLDIAWEENASELCKNKHLEAEKPA